jgi:transposase
MRQSHRAGATLCVD